MNPIINITYQGIEKPLVYWARKYSIPGDVLRARYHRKEPINANFFRSADHDRHWTVLNLKLHEYSANYRQRMEELVVEMLKKERKRNNKAKYKWIRSEIERTRLYAPVSVEEIVVIQDTIARLEDVILQLKSRIRENLKVA